MANRLKDVSHHPSIERIRHSLGEEAELHLVGGLVRDALANLPVTDIDLATKFHPDEVTSRLEKAGIRVVDTGAEHGTVTAVLGEESHLYKHIEITTFREPSLRVSSKFSKSISEDLSGRDFTINAIAYDISRDSIIDPFDGQGDLKKRILRAVGSPEDRFSEDPLRVMRLIRFGPGEDRSLDNATHTAAKKLAPELKSVSIERIRNELEKILLSPNPRSAFRLMNSMGILALVLPEALPSVNFEQNIFHHEDVFEHTLTVIEKAPRERLARLSALFHDLGKPHTLSIGDEGRRHFYLHELKSEELTKEAMTRLKFSIDDTRSVSNVVKLHMRPIDCGPTGVRRIMRDAGQNFDLWRTLKVADSPPAEEAHIFEEKLRAFDAMVQEEKDRIKGSVYGKLAVNGDDLISLGLKPGKAIGECLSKLEEIVIENPDLNDRENLLPKAKEFVSALLAEGKSKA